MSKDSNEERDDEIIVSFAKAPPAPAVAARTTVRVPSAAKEGAADAEVVARISSERVVAAAEPMDPGPLQRASAGEEQSRSSSSVAPKSVLVLIGGRCAFS